MKYYGPSNWGANLCYEVPEKDVMAMREALRTAVMVEIDPPAWALLATCKLGGQRHEKRHLVVTQPYGPYGAYGGSGTVGGGYTPHYPPQALIGPLAESRTEGYQRAIERRNRKKNGRGTLNEEPAARKQVPTGNQRNEDYRLWKGFVPSDMAGAHCRWCQLNCSSKSDMQRHAALTDCKERLLALYRFAKQMHGPLRYCFACKKPTEHFMWGVPLCNTISCIGRWKFSNREGLQGFAMYLQWAMEAQTESPEDGPFSHLPEVENYGH